jgi:uridine kinase
VDFTAPGSRPAVTARLAGELIAARSTLDHPLRVAIDGRSTPGKTSFANELAAQLADRGIECVRASIDDFHHPGHKYRSIRHEWTPETRLAEGNDYASFRRLLLEPLGPGGDRRYRPRLFDSFRDEPWPEEWFEAEPDSIAVVDAAFALLPQLAGCWDYSIWLDISTETMMSRALERDVWLAGSREEVRLRYEQNWQPTHALYESAYRPIERANCVIDNDDVANPRIVRI